MKMPVKSIIVALIGLGLAFYIWDFLGKAAYGHKWKYRVGTYNIEESIKRGVFVKKMHFQIDSFSGPPFSFEAFIERDINMDATQSMKPYLYLIAIIPFN